MAWHKEGQDLVWDSPEQGIADAPEQGTAFMRNINLVSIPGEACVNYATSAINVPPATLSPGISCTMQAAGDTITWANSATLYTGVAITFGSSTGGVTAGTVYWISNVSGATFKVYTNINHDQLVDVTSDVSNTFTIITFGQPTYKTLDYIGTATSPNNVFILDLNGRAWWVNLSGNLVFLGNTTLTSTHGNGICAYGAFLYVFRDANIDYMTIDSITNSSAPAWTYGWQSVTSPSASANYSHYAIAAQDNGMYFCNNQTVGSVLAKSGQTTVDPSNAATYTYNTSALLLPSVDRTTCLAELGTLLMVGAIQNKVYPWDRISTSYNYPIVLAENYTTRMVTTNSTTYIFAGNRGRIYQTNGSNVQLFKKIPDHIIGFFASSGGLDPYYSWLDATYWKNQIYFSFLTYKNDGTQITNIGGLWAVDISMPAVGQSTPVALRMTNTMAGGASLYPYVIAPNIRSTTPAGAGLYLPWSSQTITSYGVDVTSSTPYISTSAIFGEIYTDLLPTGVNIGKKTFNQLEFKLAEQMVSGEMVRISVRQSYSDSWTVMGTTTDAVLSDVYPMPVQNGEWIEFYVELQSTSTTPSLVRLKQLRLR